MYKKVTFEEAFEKQGKAEKLFYIIYEPPKRCKDCQREEYVIDMTMESGWREEVKSKDCVWCGDGTLIPRSFKDVKEAKKYLGEVIEE